MIRRRLLGAAAAGLTLVAGGFVGASPASAATYDGQTAGVGNSCDASATTVKRADISTLGWVELRYSSTCRTTWARVYSYNGYQPSIAYGASALIHRNSDGKQYSCSFSYAGQTYCFTPMVNDSGVTSYAWGEIDSGVQWYHAQTASY